jgi:hypothetical protein
LSLQIPLLKEIFYRLKKRRLRPPVQEKNYQSGRQSRPRIKKSQPNNDTRKIFINYQIELPSKELLDFIHRIASDLANENPEVYRTFLPSALLATGTHLLFCSFHSLCLYLIDNHTRNCFARVSHFFDGTTRQRFVSHFLTFLTFSNCLTF